MPLITALEGEPRSGGVRLQLDGRPFATVAAGDVAALALREGLELDQGKLAALERCANTFAARIVALRLLGARALPGRELERRLTRRGHEKGIAQVVVAELVASGLVNDGEFARHFARTRARRLRLGPARLARELQRMGIGQREAELAVREALEADGVDTLAVLRDAADRKVRALRGKDPAYARRSLRAFLLRRGFSGGDIAAYLKEIRLAG